MKVWTATSKGARKRKKPVRLHVLHHTGGERDHVGVCQTLETREPALSIHDIVGNDGMHTSHADIAAVVTLHAGEVNEESHGTEITNRGTGEPATKWPREAYTDTVHNKRVRFLKFYPRQVDAVDAHCRDSAVRFGYKLRLPMGPDGRVLRRKLTPAELKAYKETGGGVLGHFHVSENKIDPSPHLLDELAARWKANP